MDELVLQDLIRRGGNYSTAARMVSDDLHRLTWVVL